MNNIRTNKIPTKTHINKIRQTFTLPEEVFRRFAVLVPEGKRSAVVSLLIEQEAKRREQALARACDVANQDAGLTTLEQDFQTLEDTVLEPWESHGG